MKGASFRGEASLCGHHDQYVPGVTGSCRVNKVHGHRQCTWLADNKFICGREWVVLICLRMYRSGLDECLTVILLLDSVLSPLSSWVYRESALLYSLEENQVPQGLPVSVPWQWKGWQPGRVCGSALIIIVESPESTAWGILEKLQGLSLGLPAHPRQVYDVAAIKQH